MSENWILVNKPFLPPKSEYYDFIDGIWERNYLTNNGPLLVDLEKKLENYLRVNHLSIVTNGTISLQIALKSLNKKGKVLTTPFSYIATVSSIVWEGFEPVFIDIDEQSYNVDASLIEANIEDDVVAMIFTHTFGVPCDVDAISLISEKYNIPVIYDAAHAFAVSYKGKSILNYGYASSLSFHATKLFHTIEGGALVTKHAAVQKQIELLRNFGHNGPEVFDAVGVNGKNSEFHAAMGHCNLVHIDSILEQRKEQYQLYLTELNNTLQFQKVNHHTDYNYAYMPVVFASEEQALLVKSKLEENFISPRRYFYPSLNSLDIFKDYRTACPHAESIASRILCLPLYHELTDDSIIKIAGIINACL